jgi:hypothetical protein
LELTTSIAVRCVALRRCQPGNADNADGDNDGGRGEPENSCDREHHAAKNREQDEDARGDEYRELLALLPATVIGAFFACGELQAILLGVLACNATLEALLVSKYTAIPRFAEFEGQVVEAWIEVDTDENSTTTHFCLAIDDGIGDRAWAFSAGRVFYTRFTPGTLVQARVNPRQNTLLSLEVSRLSSAD